MQPLFQGRCCSRRVEGRLGYDSPRRRCSIVASVIHENEGRAGSNCFMGGILHCCQLQVWPQSIRWPHSGSEESQAVGHLQWVLPHLYLPLPSRLAPWPDDRASCFKLLSGRTEVGSPSTGIDGATSYGIRRLLLGQITRIHARGCTRQTTIHQTHSYPTNLLTNLKNSKPPTIGASNAPPWRNTNLRGNKIFTSKEINEKRAKGLCFGCNDY